MRPWGGGLRALVAWLAPLALLLGGASVWAEPPRDTADFPAIALIIDDLGNESVNAERALALPGALTYAFLPHTPHARRLAEAVHRSGREIMLHLPMESVEPRALGPGGLSLDMTRGQLRATLAEGLASVPHVRGVNNHMGSLLTRHPGHMEWLMSDLAEPTRLYFVDSRTTHHTVAHRVAAEHGVPFIERDVFLDHERSDRAFVLQQWRRLIAEAHRQGIAVGIGHPYPVTLEVLEEMIPQLESEGIRLVPVSRLIALKEQARLWQASLSPSPKAARN